MKKLSARLLIYTAWIFSGLLVTENLLAETSRTALVLGGGGARGAAHIGVLEVLERERIPIDCVVGTSMGALVASSYAAGLSPQQMREKLSQADWTDIFLDIADYSQLSYRKKKVSQRFLRGTELGVTHNGLQLQSGLVAGEKIKLYFNQLVDANLGERNIEDLSIPLAIVATDIGTGERVVFRDGSLTLAMRASMSVPGFMSPVEYQGRKLVDGGLVDNLPVELGRELCKADRVIAINVGSPLKATDNIGSLVSVTAQMVGILTQQNVQRSIASLTNRDVYIYPDLTSVKASEFSRHAEIADLGRAAAEQHLQQLKTFSVEDSVYLAWKEKNKHQPNPEVMIDEIRIAPTKRVHPDYVARQIHQTAGQLLDREQLEDDLIRIYGDGFYQTVDYRVMREGDRNRLDILVREKDWSYDYLVLGYAIENEYRQDSNFNVRAAYRNTWMNNLGGEFFASADIGGKPRMELDFYQPLDSHHRFFIEPYYARKREPVGIFIDDERIAEYRLDTGFSELALGANLGNYGQSTLGWRDYHIKGEADISQVPLPDVDERFGGVIFEMNLDRRNRLYFPSKGWRMDLSYFDSQHQDYSKLSADLGGAYRMGDYVVALRSEYVTSLKGELPFYDAVMLGGFLKMSGYATNQILGDDAVYGHIRAERIIGRMPLGMSGDLRLGFGLEAAKLDTNYTLSAGDDWLDSGVLYLGGETPFGPLYLGYGFTFSGDYNLYLQLGAL